MTNNKVETVKTENNKSKPVHETQVFRSIFNRDGFYFGIVKHELVQKARIFEWNDDGKAVTISGFVISGKNHNKILKEARILLSALAKDGRLERERAFGFTYVQGEVEGFVLPVELDKYPICDYKVVFYRQQHSLKQLKEGVGVIA